MGKIAAVPVLGGIALSAGSRKGRWFIRPSNNRHRRLGHLVAGLLLGGIALPALAITGFYGMNIKQLPWAESPHALWIVIGLILLDVNSINDFEKEVLCTCTCTYSTCWDPGSGIT